ncbi:MAG: hypothetical protein V7K40_22735 [Nostoc sp.]
MPNAQCPMPNTTLGEAAPTAYLGFATSTPLSTSRHKSPNSWRGFALSVAMPQALRLRSGQAQYKCPMQLLERLRQ